MQLRAGTRRKQRQPTPRARKEVTLFEPKSANGLFKKEEIFEPNSNGEKGQRAAVAFHFCRPESIGSSDLAQTWAEKTVPPISDEISKYETADLRKMLAENESGERKKFWSEKVQSGCPAGVSPYIPFGKSEDKKTNNFFLPLEDIWKCPKSYAQLPADIKTFLDNFRKAANVFEVPKAQLYFEGTQKAKHNDPRLGKLKGTPYVKMLTKLGGNIWVLDIEIECSACTIVVFDSDKEHEVKAVETIGVTLHHQAYDRRFERFLASKDDDEFRASVEAHADALIKHLLKFKSASTPREFNLLALRFLAFEFPLLAAAIFGLGQSGSTQVLRLVAEENKTGFNCIHCQKFFKGKAAKEHRDVHPNPTGWRCPTNRNCGITHKTRSEYRACNSKKNRNRFKCRFKCTFEGCNAAFAQSSHLKAHNLTHTGEKPFKCKFEGCNAAFAESGNLTRHHRIHTKETPFKCKFEGCNAAFAQSGHLTRHHRIHTKEKPFKCKFEGCNAAFAESGHLTAHHRIHTGEKPFKCRFEGCNAAFAQSGHLKRHYKSKKHSSSGEPAHKRGEPDPKRRKH